MENVKRPIPKPRKNVLITSNHIKTEYENVKVNIIKDINEKNEEVSNNQSSDETDNQIYNKLQNQLNEMKIEDDEKRPVPAPRRRTVDNESELPIQQNEQQYGNIESLIPKDNPQKNINSNSINLSSRKAPEIPNRVKNNTNNKDINSPPKTNNLSKSNDQIFEEKEDEFDYSRYKRKSFSGSVFSNSSTNSTHSSNENIPKYKNRSPSDLLKTLGATSKLLTDSISERVAARTKDAKHKIDKKISETSHLATTKLKNVRKKITSMGPSNFSLVRDKKLHEVDDFDCGRPQTLPPNDAILNSISFNSPLNNKMNNFEDLTTAESSYEIPKSTRRFYLPSPPPITLSISDTYPPSYDEVTRTPPPLEKSNLSISDSDSSLSLGSATLCFERNAPMTQSMYSAVGARTKLSSPNQGKLHKNKSDSNIFAMPLSTPLIEVSSSDSSSNERLPCPSIPAPVLKPDEIYGKINKIATEHVTVPPPLLPVRPARQKRKNYENVELRQLNIVSSSTRATVDSKEIKNRNEELIDNYPRIFSRDIAKPSLSKSGRLLKENFTDSSESWSFYDISREEQNENSSPEPIYENNDITPCNKVQTDESVYVKLCEMDSDNDRFLLKPFKANLITKNERASNPVAPNMFKHDDDIENSNQSTSLGQLKDKIILTDILKEFDPLTASTSSASSNSQANENAKKPSNKLFLLEQLLSDDTYGNRDDQNNFIGRRNDSPSLNLSTESDYDDADEDNDSLNLENQDIPTPPERVDSLNIDLSESRISADAASSSSKSPEMVIIHQNLGLRSDSIENIVDESVIAPFLTQTTDSSINISEPVDLSLPSSSKTNWFVEGSEEDYRKQQKIDSINRNDKKNVDKVVKSIPKINVIDNREAPPPYNEAMMSSCTSLSSVKVQEERELPPPPPASPGNIKSSSSVKNMFSSVMEGINKNLKRKASIKQQETRTIIEMVPKPSLSPRYIHHEGHLIKFPTGVVEDILKELSPRMAVLREKRFSAFLDMNHKQLKEQFLLDYITTIQCVNNQKLSNTQDMHCFEITVSLPKNHAHHQALSNPNMIISSTNSANRKVQRITYVYGIAKRAERNIWMQKLIECMTDVFPTKYSCEYTRAGWCYLKNSISSDWSGSWLLLSGRKLLFYSCNEMNLEMLDLRKARCIILKEFDDSIGNLHVEKGQILMIDCPPYTIYIIMNCPRETKIWRHIIRESAHNNGRSLKHQQLTKDNVPVIVDKCINFIYTHGSMSEGIYRKSGSEGNIQKLLSAFSSDAFDVQITRTDYNEHDVANVLKRFMRDLPERLLQKYAISFLSVSEMKSSREKIKAYKELLARLSTIEYQTLKKLLGHLNFIQSQKTRNKMDVGNLALIWGISLLRKNNRDDDVSFFEGDSRVLGDLIVLYKNLYQLTADEVTKEQIMLSVLQKYHAAAENLSDSVKQSGDLKVWITIDTDPDNEKEEKEQKNVSLTPTKTVYDICKELAIHMKIEPHNLTLNEIILNGELQRPMHFSEKPLDSVLRWTYWPDSDRKNNYLKITKTKFLELINRSIRSVGSIIPNSELKFADHKSKTVRPFILELIDNKLIIMKKEKSLITKVKEILLDECVAYLGLEKKRDLQARWSITLIDKSFQKRSRDSPFIGHIIAGTNSNDQIVWYSHILYSLYKTNILPNPEMIIP